jgi:hypothetical protein
MKHVMAISEAKNNAELIEECAQLGYLDRDWLTLDCTYGKGRFWTNWKPRQLVCSDLNPVDPQFWRGVAVLKADFTATPWADEWFDAVVIDPPFKLSGNSQNRGPASGDASYGISTYVPIEERHQLIFDGIDECLRILKPGGYLLIKCQDQVSSGRVHWQTRIFSGHAEAGGANLVDMIHLPSYRRQPKGTRQLHARRNYSTLLILRKGK